MTDTARPTAGKRPKVFISYNRADREWAEWIASVLDAAGYGPFLQAWHILPGMNFGVEMHKAASEADITVAVLSEAFLKSEFTLPEWVAAFVSDPTGRNRKLIPVRVAKCEPPGLLKAVVYIDLIGLDESAAAKSLLDGLKPKGKPAGPIPFPGQLVTQATSVASFPSSLARLHFVPELPPHFLPRADTLATVKAPLLGDGASRVAITGHGQAVGVQGMGGIGKSVLAVALAHEPDIRRAFLDGVVWLAVGQQPNLIELQGRLLRVLTGAIPDAATVHECADTIREALDGRKILLVLDDVWELDHAALFRGIPDGCWLLVTMRNTEVLTGLEATEFQVDLLTPEESLRLLADWSGLEREALPAEAPDIVRECRQLPLAVAAIGAMVRLGPTAWQDALTRLRRADLDKVKKSFPDYPYPHLLRALEVSVEALPPEDRERCLDLAVFPEEAAVPEGPLRLLWKLDDLDTRDAMRRLAARSLATLRETSGEGLSLTLHDLQRDLVRKCREEGLPQLHARLVEAYAAACETRSPMSEVRRGSKWALGPDDGYHFQRLPWHLKEARRVADLRSLLLDLYWLQAKLNATDIAALIADYDLLREDKELGLIQSAIRLSAHILRRDPSQLVSQLQGRLHWMEPRIARMEEQWNEASTPWLRLLTPTLPTPAGPLIEVFDEKNMPVKTRTLAVAATGMVVSGDDHGVRVWDLATGAERFAFSSIEQRPNGRYLNKASAITLTPDHSRVIVCFDLGSVRIWNLATGDLERVFDGPQRPRSVAVTPNGRHLIEGFHDGLRVWDLARGHIRYYVDRPATAIAMSATGTCLIAGGETVSMWDVEAGLARGEFRCGGNATSLVVTPDGAPVIVGGTWDDSSQICSYDVGSGRLLREFRGHTVVNDWYWRGSSARISALAITPDGTTLLSAAGDHTVRVWNIETGEMQAVFAHPGTAVALAILPDGRSAISAGYDNTVRMWRLAGPKSNVRAPRHTGDILAVAFSPNGKWLLSGGEDCVVRLWDTTSWESVGAFEGHTRRIHAIAITPDSRRAITAGLDDSIRVWEIPSGRLEHTFEGHTYCVRGLAAVPDGRHIVSVAEDTMIGVWDLDRKEQSGWFASGAGELQAVSVTPDGQKVLFCQGGFVHAILLATGAQVLKMGSFGEGIATIAVAPDGTQAVRGTPDGTVEVWSLQDGRRLRAWSGLSPILSVAVTAGGRLITGDTDGTIRIADVHTGRCIASFNGDNPNMIAAVSPDGRTIVGGDSSGQVHVLQTA